MGEKMLWNKDKTHAVRASRIRSIGVHQIGADMPYLYSDSERRFRVLGWYNADEHFLFGLFPTIDEAVKFTQGLCEQMEE